MKNFLSYSQPFKIKIATIIAVVFHLIGLTGILFFDTAFFLAATPFNLLLMFLLILYTQEQMNRAFVVFILICCLIGFAMEVVGVNTGYLFGKYQYGTSLGAGWKNVPFIIGINWFIVIYCCGNAVYRLMNRMLDKVSVGKETIQTGLRSAAIIGDATILAVLFDFLMEPAAIKLGYWRWLGDGSVPFFNYLCWFMVSLMLTYCFTKLKFHKGNKFAVHLLLIQGMFFLLVRTFL